MLDCEQGNRQEDVECTKQAGGNEVKTGRRVRVRGGRDKASRKSETQGGRNANNYQAAPWRRPSASSMSSARWPPSLDRIGRAS